MRGPRKPTVKKARVSVHGPRKRTTTRKKAMMRTAKRARPKRPAMPKMPKDSLGEGENEPMPGEDTEEAL